MEEKLVNVEFECPMCGVSHCIQISREDFVRYMELRKKKVPIQEIFPKMSQVDREKFLSGYCDDCQKLIFGGK